MLLNGLDKLLARLCLKIRPSQLEKLLSCSRLSPSVKSTIYSNIKYLKMLRKISPSIQQFLVTLKECLETLDDSHDLLDLLKRFHRVYPRLEVLEQEPSVPLTRCVASVRQRGDFSRTLVRISNELNADHLEILVALSPTPDGRKDALTSGVKFLDELQCHGCITEDNTDLLEDLFRVLQLAKPAALLEEYRTTYSLPSAGALERHPSIASGDLPHLPLPPSPPVEPRRPDPTNGYRTPHQRRPDPTHGSRTPHQRSLPLPPSPPVDPRRPDPTHGYRTPHQRRPDPPHYSTPHQESSPLIHPPLKRTVRPVNSPLPTPTPTTGDQRPFPAPYNMDPVYPRPRKGASRSVRGSDNSESVYPPPVNEALPSAPPIQHILHSNTSPPPPPVNEALPSAPPIHHIHSTTSSTLSSYTAAHSREMFAVPVRVSNEPPLMSEAAKPPLMSEAAKPQLMSGAAKGTLGASKFPNKELNKSPGPMSSRELTKTAAPPALNTFQPVSAYQTPIDSQSTAESYEHVSNWDTAEERIRTGDLNEVVVGNMAPNEVNIHSESTAGSYVHVSNTQLAEERHCSGGNEVVVGNMAPNEIEEPQNSRSVAVACEERPSTVPLNEALLMIQKANQYSPLPVLSRSQLQGDEENIPSINVAVSPLNSQENGNYDSPPSPVVTKRVPDEPSSPVGEETSRKRSRGDEEEMVVNKRRRSSRIPAKTPAKKSIFKRVGEFLGLSSVKEENID